MDQVGTNRLHTMGFQINTFIVNNSLQIRFDKLKRGAINLN